VIHYHSPHLTTTTFHCPSLASSPRRSVLTSPGLLCLGRCCVLLWRRVQTNRAHKSNLRIRSLFSFLADACRFMLQASMPTQHESHYQTPTVLSEQIRFLRRELCPNDSPPLGTLWTPNSIFLLNLRFLDSKLAAL